MAKKTQTTENLQLSKTSELSRVEWLKNGLPIGISYGKGDLSEMDPKLAVELEDAGFVKVLEAGTLLELEAEISAELEAEIQADAPEADTL